MASSRRAMPAPGMTEGQGNPEEHEIRYHQDYGTTQGKVSYQVARKGSPPDASSPATVLALQDHKLLVSSTTGFLKIDGKWQYFWGRAFERAARELDEGEKFEFSGLKMCLYHESVGEQHRKRVEEELDLLQERTGLEYGWKDLITLHLQALRTSVRSPLVERERLVWTAGQLEQMTERWTFSVPEIATLDTNDDFSKMIKAAGYPEGIMFVTETEALVAWRLYEYASNLRGRPSAIKENDIILVVDGGGLTINLAAYRIRGPLRDGVAVPFDIVWQDGLAKGSQTLVDRCVEYLEERLNSDAVQCPGGLAGFCSSIGWTSSQLVRRIGQYLESFKAAYKEDVKNFPFEGRDPRTGREVQKSFQLTRRQFRAWLRDIFIAVSVYIDLFLGRVDRGEVVCSGKVHAIMGGGLFRNEELFDMMFAAFSARMNIMHEPRMDIGPSDPSVVLGAPLRSVPGQSTLTGNHAVGGLRDEYLNKRLHKDITDLASQTYETHEGRYVKDCWTNFIEFGDIASSKVREKTWQVDFRYFVHESDPWIREWIFIADRHIPEHTVALKDGNLAAGIQRWRFVERLILLTLLRRYPVRDNIKKDGRTGRHSEVHAVLKLNIGNTGKVGLAFEFTDPSWDAAKTRSRKRPRTSNYLGFDPEVLHDPAYPSFVQRNRFQGTDKDQPGSERGDTHTHRSTSEGSESQDDLAMDEAIAALFESSSSSDDSEAGSEYKGRARRPSKRASKARSSNASRPSKSTRSKSRKRAR